MDFSLDKSTIIWLIAIVAGTCSLYLYIKKLKDKNKLISNRRLVENIPSIISTIGVLGTMGLPVDFFHLILMTLIQVFPHY